MIEKRRKKPSIRRDSNPRPQEFCSAGVCSTSVLPRCPRVLAKLYLMSSKRQKGKQLATNKALYLITSVTTATTSYLVLRGSRRGFKRSGCRHTIWSVPGARSQDLKNRQDSCPSCFRQRRSTVKTGDIDQPKWTWVKSWWQIRLSGPIWTFGEVSLYSRWPPRTIWSNKNWQFCNLLGDRKKSKYWVSITMTKGI